MAQNHNRSIHSTETPIYCKDTFCNYVQLHRSAAWPLTVYMGCLESRPSTLRCPINICSVQFICLLDGRVLLLHAHILHLLWTDEGNQFICTNLFQFVFIYSFHCAALGVSKHKMTVFEYYSDKLQRQKYYTHPDTPIKPHGEERRFCHYDKDTLNYTS